MTDSGAPPTADGGSDAGGSAWIASGYGKLGITLPPSGARSLAQAMLGEAPEVDLWAFDPARFDT
jgi:glycine/D-amino acid oxidase-like deaminating enzyme